LQQLNPSILAFDGMKIGMFALTTKKKPKNLSLKNKLLIYIA
jgi:hypothetical protein